MKDETMNEHDAIQIVLPQSEIFETVTLKEFMRAEKVVIYVIAPAVIVCFAASAFFVLGVSSLAFSVPFTIIMLLESSGVIEPNWPDVQIVQNQLYAKNAKEYWLILAFLGILSRFLIPFGVAMAWTVMTDDYSVTKIHDHLPTEAIVVIFLVFSNMLYWFRHWCSHKITCCWKLYHQMHHTIQRYNIWLGLWFHPIESVTAAVDTIIAETLWGLSPTTIFILTCVHVLIGALAHANIRTPYWLGFFVVRPEQHVIHHEEPWPRPEGWKRRMFCDLPVVDMLFGTFVNPKKDQREDPNFIVGFPKYQHLWKKQLFAKVNVRELRLHDVKPIDY